MSVLETLTDIPGLEIGYHSVWTRHDAEEFQPFFHVTDRLRKCSSTNPRASQAYGSAGRRPSPCSEVDYFAKSFPLKWLSHIGLAVERSAVREGGTCALEENCFVPPTLRCSR